MKTLERIRPWLLAGAVLLSLPLAMPEARADSPIARFELVAGDRQIAIATQDPPQPYAVRALDADGRPVAHAVLRVGPVAYGGPFLIDEFRFAGFNAAILCHTCIGVPLPGFDAVTDANGVARFSAKYLQHPSSAFPYGARPADTSNVQAFFSVVLLGATPAGNPSVAVEYFNTDVGHYFNTNLEAEIDALERGVFKGWTRSTGALPVWPTKAEAPAGAVPVCRFFSARYTSHFYTADPGECDAVIANWPDVWTLETREAFYVFTPDPLDGACAAGLQPVYRMYNNRPGPNHRYITDRSLRDRMTGAGWRAEGYGPEAVMFCVPA
ncbi:MAG: hypothetical protein U1F58_18190 [Burkholderiales bacterium]